MNSKRRPCWCPTPILWELYSFLMQMISFVLINLHRCWPHDWKHSIRVGYVFDLRFSERKIQPISMIFGILNKQYGTLENVIYFLVAISSHSHGQFAVGDNEKNKTIVILVFTFTPRWQTSRANVLGSLKSLNKLPNTGVFIAAEKWMVRSTGVGGLISLQNRNLQH